MSRNSGLGSAAYLHLLTLSCLALAQPLLDLIGKNAEFLVARGSGRGDILVLVVFLLILAPLPLLLIAFGARRIGPRAGAFAQAILVALLAAAIALPLFGRLESWPDGAVLAAAAGSGSLLAWAYGRLPSVRFFLTALSLALVAVPASFLLQRPIRSLLAPAPTAPSPAAAFEPSAPIVVVIFDELPLSALLGPGGEINDGLFPGFADLARHSTWFKDAVTVADTTEAAVPAILTGRLPRPGTLPIPSDHPQNLFTLVGRDYSIFAHEPVSELAPEENRLRASRASAPQRLAGLASDLGVVYLHLLAPSGLEARLPPVTQGWVGFAARAPAQVEPAEQGLLRDSDRIFRAALAGLVRDRREELSRFIAAIEPESGKALYFLHVLLPHFPLEYLPSGTAYRTPPDVPGLAQEVWETNPWLLRQAEQRFLLQLGFVDRFLIDLFAKLEAGRIFDPALIVVTADHGISFVGGESRRQVQRANLPEILRVPLFIKAPGQTVGAVVERPVSSVDILPTMLDLLDAPQPWPMDGRSGFLDAPARNEIFAKDRGMVAYDSDTRAAGAAPPMRPTLFGRILDTAELFRIGPEPELLGRSLSELPTRIDAALAVRLEGEQAYERVAPATRALPALVAGRIQRPGESPEAFEIAIALNGIVRATTHAYRDSAGGSRFAALVPEESFQKGRNEVRVGVIERRGDEPGLVLPPASEARRAELVLEGARLIGLQVGPERIPVVPGSVTGFIERTRRHRGSIEISGWAAEIGQGLLPREILIFSDGHLVYSGMTAISEQRIVERYGNPAIELCGFRFEIPEDLVAHLETKGLHAVAISSSEKASELGYFHRLERQVNGDDVITVTNGRRIPVRPGAIAGIVERRERTAAGIEIEGWAADPDHPEAVLWVLAFAGGKNVYWATPSVPRADVARLLGRPGIPNPGFELLVPTSALQRPGQEVRLVALSSRKVATELLAPRPQ